MSYETSVILTLRKQDLENPECRAAIDDEPENCDSEGYFDGLAEIVFHEVHNGTLCLEDSLKRLKIPFDTYYEREDCRWETQRVRYADGEVSIYLLSDQEAAERYHAIMQAAKGGLVAGGNLIGQYWDLMRSSPDLIDLVEVEVEEKAEEPQFRNYYRHCGEEWEDVWSCACNDECPVCKAEIEPYQSDALNTAAEEL